MFHVKNLYKYIEISITNTLLFNILKCCLDIHLSLQFSNKYLFNFGIPFI